MSWDKLNVPATIVTAFIVQAVAAGWFFSGLSSRVEALENRSRTLDIIASKVEAVSERLTKIETQNQFVIEMIRDMRADIKATVDSARK